VTRFYFPLLLQAFSQSLTYPLVAGIVTHGVFGVNGLTAFSQGLMIMFMVGALGAGLVTTGLVFARTWYGHVSFRRLNALMAATLLVLQCLLALPPFSGWLFRGFFALSPELADVSASVLLFSALTNLGFFLRNVPMVVLFNNFESGKANNATLIRIAVTVLCSVFFPRLGWTGPAWGVVALTVGVWVELGVTWAYARPYVRELRETEVLAPAALNVNFAELVREQFRFTLPLSLGGFLLATSPLIVAAFIVRAANAADMLTVHYVTIGVANPVAYAALRLQTVSVKFPPEHPGDRRLLWYALGAGAVLGIVPFLFAMPGLGNWYFSTYQNVPDRLIPTARLAIGIYSAVAIIHAVRARIEGIAAARKLPGAVMAGEITYTAALFLTLAVLFPLGLPGWVMAISAIFVAPACVAAAVYAALWYNERQYGRN
jgi:hypothetical protein